MSETYDMVCKQGETFLRRMNVTRRNGEIVSLLGYTAKMQIRKTHSSKTVMLELSTANERISITGSTGLIVLRLTDEITGTLPAVGAVYDLVLTDEEGNSFRFLEGKFVIQAGVTRESNPND